MTARPRRVGAPHPRLDPQVVVPDAANPVLCEGCWGLGYLLFNRRQVVCRTCYGTGCHPTLSGVRR